MEHKLVNTSEIRRIIDRTISTIEETRNEVFSIVENAREEVRRVKAEMKAINEQIAKAIADADALQVRDRLMRQHLVTVSKDFAKYTETDIKDAYDKASETRLQYFMKQQEEKDLKDKRAQLEHLLRQAQKVLESAERLINQVGLAMNYLSGDLTNTVQSGTDERINLGIRILEAREEERKRISRDIHDGPAQAMANIVLKADICKTLMERDVQKGLNELDELKVTVRETLKDIRKIIYDLRPMSLDDLGLAPTVRRFAQEFTEECGIKVEVRIGQISDDVESIVKLAVYRLIQEIFNNIRKHSKATKAVLILEFGTQFLQLTIADNGVGFNVEEALEKARQHGNSFGLLGIHERVEQLQGKIKYENRPGGGTQVEVILPINREVMQDEGNAHTHTGS